MMHLSTGAFAAALAGALLGLVARPAAGGAQQAGDVDRACNAVRELRLPNTQILDAAAIRPSSEYVVPQTADAPADRGGPVRVGRAFCRVAGNIDGAIRFEVWMPLDGWNGRFQGLGLGAFSGAIPYASMNVALAQGYAVGGTDTGHESSFTDASWTLNAAGLDREKVADWAFRGIHEMTVKSQAIVAAVYGTRPKYSYFVGCSSGGHQALTEAQRYPDDYDGIVAGAPANHWTHLMAAQLWFGLATRQDPATDLEAPQDKLDLIHSAVLRQCDANDGVRDGVVENPLTCHFNPAVLACKGHENAAAACLSPAQLGAVRKIYAAAPGSDGQRIFPGLAPGSESGWRLMSAVQVGFAETFYRYFVFQDMQWRFSSLKLAADVAYADRSIGATVNSIDADLRPFRARGGKLLQYHGWNDPLISPYSSIDYYRAVGARVGPQSEQSFYRLFMVPGMAHCRGGDGADSFDALGALEGWVERSVAPDRLEAAKMVDGKAVRTHPLCPFPQVARYRGKGNPDESRSFSCASARQAEPRSGRRDAK
jgi:feruloyl esterase